MTVVVRAGQKLLGIYNKGSLKTYQEATNIIIQRCEFLKVVKKLGFSDLLVSALSQEIASHCYDIFLFTCLQSSHCCFDICLWLIPVLKV